MLAEQRTPCTDCMQIRPIVHNYMAPRTVPPAYVPVRAVVWECGEGQADRQTDRQTDRHIDGRDQYTFRLGYTSRKM